MALAEVDLVVGREPVPGEVRAFLRDADRRARRLRRDARLPAFVPCDYERAYRVLRAVAEAELEPGSFCEWGSGLGVVACLAAMLDFEACGIEVEAELVGEACALADEFELPVEFVHGSFLPEGAEVGAQAGGFCWLATDEPAAHAQLGLDPDDFDVTFAYPWPDEEAITASVFDRYGRRGALLVTYHGSEDFRVRRKKR